jgi:MoxR-like ATPase
MLERILKLYVMAMAGDVRSPVPHLFGPPGCGKSTVVYQLGQLVGRKVHTVNVSRLSPLEVEGVQMPHSAEGQDMKLKMLLATLWANLREGDIILFDEFLRGFPEVYNALLDIITSREVAGFKLPKVFIIAASNSTVAYDKALEDRLLHISVPDPRTNKSAKKHLAQLLVEQIGLLPDMATSMEMQNLLDTEVLPMFEVLDALKNKSSSAPVAKGRSVRNLIGQAQLREIESAPLKELLDMNNHRAAAADKWQYIVLHSGKNPNVNYVERSRKLPKDKLTPLQALNLELNHQLLELETARAEKEGSVTDDDDVFDPPF